MTRTIQVDHDVLDYLEARRLSPAEPILETLRRELGLVSVDVDDETYAYLLSRALVIGEPASQILRRELGLGEPTDQPTDHPVPTVVEFRIPAGTGSQPWNTSLTPVSATVGEVLRIVNDDSVAHRLHTNGVPFPHAANDIPPGGSAEFRLEHPFAGSTPLYDHDFGSAAEFWITVRDSV